MCFRSAFFTLMSCVVINSYSCWPYCPSKVREEDQLSEPDSMESSQENIVLPEEGSKIPGTGVRELVSESTHWSDNNESTSVAESDPAPAQTPVPKATSEVKVSNNPKSKVKVAPEVKSKPEAKAVHEVKSKPEVKVAPEVKPKPEADSPKKPETGLGPEAPIIDESGSYSSTIPSAAPELPRSEALASVKTQVEKIIKHRGEVEFFQCGSTDVPLREILRDTQRFRVLKFEQESLIKYFHRLCTPNHRNCIFGIMNDLYQRAIARIKADGELEYINLDGDMVDSFQSSWQSILESSISIKKDIEDIIEDCGFVGLLNQCDSEELKQRLREFRFDGEEYIKEYDYALRKHVPAETPLAYFRRLCIPANQGRFFIIANKRIEFGIARITRTAELEYIDADLNKVDSFGASWRSVLQYKSLRAELRNAIEREIGSFLLIKEEVGVHDLRYYNQAWIETNGYIPQDQSEIEYFDRFCVADNKNRLFVFEWPGKYLGFGRIMDGGELEWMDIYGKKVDVISWSNFSLQNFVEYQGEVMTYAKQSTESFVSKNPNPGNPCDLSDDDYMVYDLKESGIPDRNCVLKIGFGGDKYAFLRIQKDSPCVFIDENGHELDEASDCFDPAIISAINDPVLKDMTIKVSEGWFGKDYYEKGVDLYRQYAFEDINITQCLDCLGVFRDERRLRGLIIKDPEGKNICNAFRAMSYEKAFKYITPEGAPVGTAEESNKSYQKALVKIEVCSKYPELCLIRKFDLQVFNRDYLLCNIFPDISNHTEPNISVKETADRFPNSIMLICTKPISSSNFIPELLVRVQDDSNLEYVNVDGEKVDSFEDSTKSVSELWQRCIATKH